MDNILNRNGIKDYSKRYAQHVVADHFENSDSISGDQIKSLTSIKQVNLFIIKGLFEEWQKETQNLKSPYFDFECEEVKTALTAFMNVLSKNISIKKENFQPLVERATEESILLIFSPFDFYDHLTEHYDAEISAENLLKIIRYIKINKNILDAIIKKLESQAHSKVDIQSYRSILTEVLHEIETGPEEIDEYYDAFNEVETLSESDIYGKQEAVVTEESEIAVDAPPSIEEEKVDEETGPSINDVLASNEPSLAEVHESQRIDSIQSALSINQRFMFQNALFNGDEELMSNTLIHIDRCNTKKEAMDYIYSEFPHWNIEGEEFEEFVELISRKLD